MRDYEERLESINCDTCIHEAVEKLTHEACRKYRKLSKKANRHMRGLIDTMELPDWATPKTTEAAVIVSVLQSAFIVIANTKEKSPELFDLVRRLMSDFEFTEVLCEAVTQVMMANENMAEKVASESWKGVESWDEPAPWNCGDTEQKECEHHE
jgi:hypothetical protein